MTEKKVNETKKREPDCVTEVRFGKSVLVVKGYFKENGTKTAEDIMAGYEEGMDVNEYLADVMARQVKSPVIFVEVIRHMIRDGVEMFIEVGPGETLSGFVRKTEKEVKAHNVENKESLEQAIAALKEALA